VDDVIELVLVGCVLGGRARPRPGGARRKGGDDVPNDAQCVMVVVREVVDRTDSELRGPPVALGLLAQSVPQ